MKGKRPRSVEALRAKLIVNDADLNEYVEQRVISELGSVIDRALQKCNLTQSAVARAAGMHQPDLNALIRGRAQHVPTLPTLRRLAQGLGVHFVIDIDPSGMVGIRHVEADAPSKKAGRQPTKARG